MAHEKVKKSASQPSPFDASNLPGDVGFGRAANTALKKQGLGKNFLTEALCLFLSCM